MDLSAPSPARLLLESLPDAVVLLDELGTVREATSRLAEIAGWSQEELIGRSLPELFPQHLRDELEQTLAHWRATGASPLDRRIVRVPLLTPAGAAVDVGLLLHRTPDGFSATLRDLGTSGDDLRGRLLDAVSAPDVTASSVAAAAAEVGRSFAWDLVTVWAVDPTTTTLRAVTVWERTPDPRRRFRSITLRQPLLPGEGLAGAAWQSGEASAAEDIGADPRFRGVRDVDRIPRSGATIPVRSGRRIVGVVELLAHGMVDIGLWLASETDAISTGFGQLLERYRDRLAADAVEGRLALALDAGQLGVWTLDVRSGVAQWSSRMAELHGVVATEGAADAVFATVLADDRAEVGRALARAREVDEPQTVEYRVHDPDRGTIWVSTRLTRVRAHGGPPLLSAVSADVTESKRAELSAQRRRAAIEGLQWVSQAIIAGRQLTDTAVAVANAATGVLGADLGVVLYPEPAEVGSEMAWAVSGLPGDQPLPDPPTHVEIADAARTAAGVEVVVDLRRDEDALRFVEELGLPIDHHRLRSALIVPIGGGRGRPLGLMAFFHVDRGYFTADDARLAASIGSITGVAIENAHRHEQQRLAAMTFQRQLLPRADVEMPGLDICVRYLPGRDGFDVGGDWYDVIRLGEDRIGLAVGDVCGHGLTAAAHMGQFRFSFRALLQSSSTPEEAMQVVNRLALDDLHTTATIAYVELDTATGDIAAWSCGHLPPLVASKDGSTVRWIEAAAQRAPMLGFLDTVEVAPVRARLAPDELLLLYTDGLVERRGESIDDGLDRLARSFAGRSPRLDDVCDELYGVLAEAGPDADDTVLLAVRRH
jgi:PAS domain S-box-containing protein